MSVNDVGSASTPTRPAAAPPQRAATVPQAPTGANGPGETATTGAVALQTLRQSPPQAGSPVTQQSVGRMSDIAGDARGVLTDPRAIVQHELEARNLTGTYQQLSAGQRRQFDLLSRGLVAEGTRLDTSLPAGHQGLGGFGGMAGATADPAAMKRMQEQMQGGFDRNSLYSLLQQGRLGDKDSQGNTLLTNLRGLQTADYPNARATLSTALGATQPSPYGGQTLSQQFAQGQPAEFARVANGLMRDGEVKLGNGETVRRATVPTGTGAGVGMGMMGDPNAPFNVTEQALKGYADQKLRDPAMRERVDAATEARFANDPSLGRAFGRLNEQQQDQFKSLAVSEQGRQGTALALATGGKSEPPVDQRLTGLLTSGKLTSVDSQGDTLLTNLQQLRGQRSGNGFQSEAVYNDVLSKLNPIQPPAFGGQAAMPMHRSRDWGVGLERDLNPSEYTRVMAGLTGSEGRVTVGGRTLTTPPAPPQPAGAFGMMGRSTNNLLRDAAFADAVRTGQPIDMINSDGQRHEVQISRMPGTMFGNKSDAYRMRVGNHTLSYQAPQGLTQPGNLADLANYWSMTPAHLRGELSSIKVNSGQNAADSFWAKEFNMPGFQSAATAGNNTINFYSGTRTINEGTFNHEMGHLIGQRSARETGSTDVDRGVPNGWTALGQKDGNAIESRHGGHSHDPAYSTRSVREDFAESWRAYMTARDEGTLAEFRREHPNRAPGLDRIYSNQGWR